MKYFSYIILVLLIVLSGCKHSSDVVSNGFIQKHKYRKGFHLKPLKHKLENPKSISLDSALCFNNSSHATAANLRRLNYQETKISFDTARFEVDLKEINTKFKHHAHLSWPPVFQRRSKKLENATPSEIEPVDEEQIEKSKKRLKLSSIATAIASISLLVLQA